MHIWKILPVIFILLFYVGCSSMKNTKSPDKRAENIKIENDETPPGTDKVPDDLLITLSRSACYGTCPIYELTVKADGTVLFEGEKFTKTFGKAEGKISKDKVEQLVKEFEKANYFNLNGKYDRENCATITDMPSASTSFLENGEKKSIDHYQGCEGDNADFNDEISKLRELENKIDEIVETKRWIGEGK